jgi:MFS family permease
VVFHPLLILPLVCWQYKLKKKVIVMHEYRKNRGFRALINASLLDGIGNALFNIVFVIYASTLPFNKLAVSLASLAGLLPSLLMMVTGYWADRATKKTGAMIAARFGQFALFIGLTLLIRLPGTLMIFLVLLAINVVSDILGQYSAGLGLPLFRRLLPDEALNSAMSFESATQTTVGMVFEGIGAWAIVLLHHDFALFGFINAVTFLAAALVIGHRRRLLRHAEPAVNAGANATPSFKNSLQALVKLAQENHFIGWSVALAFCVNMIGMSISGLQNVTLLQESSAWIGNYGNTVAILSITFSLGVIAGALFSNDPFKRVSIISMIGGVTALAALLGVSFMASWGIVPVIILNFVIAYLLGKVNPRFSTVLLMTVDEHHLGATMGAMSTIVTLGAPLGQAVFLGIANIISPATSWLIFAVSALAITVFTAVLTRRISDPSVFTPASDRLVPRKP